MIKTALIAAALLCAAAVPGSTVLAQQESLLIEGRIANGTPGGGAVEGLIVTLHQHTVELDDDLTYPADADGAFRFENVQYDSETAYGVSVDYQGALYGVDLDLTAGAPEPIELTIYEGTDDESVISAPVVSLLLAEVDADSQTILGMEISRIMNSADQTYVPGPEPMKLLRFGLPQGTQGLQVDTDLIAANVIQVDRGFGLSTSVPPGEHEVMFSYDFPYSNETLELSKSFPYGADQFRILVPTEGIEIDGEAFGQPEAVSVGGLQYLLFTADDIPRGERIALELRGLPQVGTIDRLGNSLSDLRWELMAPALLALLMVILIAFAVRRRGFKLASAGRRPEGEATALVQLIAELDAGHRTGSISDDDYARRYTALRSRLETIRGDS